MTPGPWEIRGTVILACHGEISQPTYICSVGGRVDSKWLEDLQAIAALPDLLAAAWNAADELYQHEGDNAAACRQDLLAAIAKAEGRTP